MKTRTQRLLAIRKIIENKKVSSQEELLEMLVKDGFQVTQATLSRDLKVIRAGKIADASRGYIYFLPTHETEQANLLSGDNFPLNGFVSIEFAWHLGVIRTLPGYASSIASAIDNMGAFQIIGTIAGDDTILIIPREEVKKEDVINVLSGILPEIAEISK
jgi:transcriptional regulator of arginine metabolism